MNSKEIHWILLLLRLATSVAFTAAQLPLHNERKSEFVSGGGGTHRNRNRRSVDLDQKIENTFNISPEPRFQLPGNLIPKHYKLEVIPFLNNAPTGQRNWTAPGAVKISVICISNTSRITLNAEGLDIHEITVHDDSTQSKPVPVNEAVYETALQFLHIDLTFGHLVSGRNYVITLKYTAPITDDLTGLYRAEYLDDQGVQKWLVVTQFASVGFRLMVPGFDEPKLKANFTTSICRSPQYNSLSNTVINGNDTGADLILTTSCPTDWKWDHYTTTVKMSSYLVALVVSEYSCTDGDDGIFGKPVEVCGPSDLIAAPKNGGDFAATAAAHLIRAFQDTFGPGLEYPMPKMYNVAIPRKYFTWGAMENWGLITYRDDRMLFFEGESLESDRYGASSLVSHELAHQWFGNLVTCEWWSHIWLNEGFATYMSYFGESKVFDEYKPREQFLSDAVQYALIYDAGSQSHPVINSALQAEVIDMTIFDGISYQKGGSLIRMMEGFLGEDILFQGLRLYLANEQYTGALQENLFEYLGQVAQPKLPEGVSLQDIMDTWTHQRGFPLVRVSVGSPNKVYISQERFKNKDAQAGKDSDPDHLWEVPIAVATEDQPDFENHEADIWLQKNVACISYNHTTSKWIMINPEGYGFYRVLYDAELTNLIQQQLDKDHTVITPLSKSQLIDDYFRLYEEGYIQIETALGMTKFLAGEPSHVVWAPVLKSFATFYQLFSSYTDAFASLKNYFAPKVEGALNAIKWKQEENEHGINVILRASLLDWACALEHPKCYDTAREYFEEWINQNITIPLDLQAGIYCAGVASGNRDYFQHVLTKFKNEEGVTEKSAMQIYLLLGALTCTKDLDDFTWLLQNSIKPDMIVYASYILQNLVKSTYAREKTLLVINDKWQEYINATESHQIIDDVISVASAYHSSEEHLDREEILVNDILLKDLDVFFKLQPTFAAVVKTIRTNQVWVSSNLPHMQKWFESNSRQDFIIT